MAQDSILQERLDLLRQITQAIGEHQDLDGIFKVVVQNVEERLPVDFACLCLYKTGESFLTVESVGAKSEALARELAMPEQAQIDVGKNGLSRCVSGESIYEPDISKSAFPFPQRLASGGLRCFVASPLQVEREVFGVLIAARVEALGFSDGDCRFLTQLADHVALAAHHAQLYAKLQNAYDDLSRTQLAIVQQERLRALGQMTGGVAHDINNAVSPILLYTEFLLETEPGLSARARSFLDIIQRASGDISHTVKRLGEFSRPSQAQALPADLNTLVLQVLALTRARWNDMAQQRGIVIEICTELAAETPTVLGVESEIREALINLVFNAVDAMPDGGRLTLSTSIAVDASGRRAQVEIADTGVGMDAEAKQRCLEPFFTTKGERGSGLGLSMVYGVAQRHGAGVEIDSVEGEGTKIKIAFPPSLSSGTEGVSDSQDVVATPSTHMRLLLIDDDVLLLTSMREVLETEGHIVVAAVDGHTGLAAFATALRNGEAFDAVITDLGMPHMDGRKVAAALKSKSPSTPVIMLTGWGQNFLSDAPKNVDCVLCKPPTLGDLRAALAKCCGESTTDKGKAA